MKHKLILSQDFGGLTAGSEVDVSNQSPQWIIDNVNNGIVVYEAFFQKSFGKQLQKDLPTKTAQAKLKKP